MKNKLAELQLQFTQNIRAPGKHELPSNVSAERMRVYQELLFNNVEGILTRCFPVLTRIISRQRWLTMVADFLANAKCQTPLFHQIPKEFIDYINTLPRDRQYPFLVDLAHYEWMELVHEIAPSTNTLTLDEEIDLIDGELVFSECAALCEYDYDVENIGVHYQPQNQVKTQLLIYRNHQEKVSFIKLNYLSKTLYQLLHAHKTARQAFALIAHQEEGLSEEVIASGGIQILAQWVEQGIILGSRRPQ